MLFKNTIEYIDNQQNHEDIYYKYRKHKEKMNLQFEAQEAGEYLYNEATATLSKEIQKYINEKI